MLIQYDVPKINKVLHDFYTATGTRVDLFDTSFIPISTSQNEMCSYCRYIQKNKNGEKSCIAFDKKLLEKCKLSQQSQQDYCPFGLLNTVSPIFYNENILGYLFFGQMKISPDFPVEQFQDDVILRADYDALATFTLPQSQSIANLAQIVIGHILTENMLKPETGEIVAKAVAFIQENLDQELSIRLIAQRINVSKSVLYKKFRDRFGCTIGEYINKKRVEQARKLLATTSLSIEEISQQCGFSSASYFTKIFKRHMGISPLKFKKNLP
jgi:AraC-like DNA-binding protein